MGKKRKVRVDLRKNRSKRPRDRQWTRGFQEHGFAEEATPSGERVRAKGDLSRRRTIVQEEGTGRNDEAPAGEPGGCLPGRVIRVHGLMNIVEVEDGRRFHCAVRRLLRTIATDERNAVTCGDRVWFRHAKAGELAERFDRYHLVRGEQVVGTAPTYRGEGISFG